MDAIVVETKRLRIREFSGDDAGFMLKLLTSPPWLDYIGDRGVYTEDEARAYLENGAIKSYKDYGLGFYKIEDFVIEAAVGMCGFIVREAFKELELGFAFLPEYIGKGYAYESARALVDWQKAKQENKSIIAITDPRNAASIRLLEKLDFEFEKTIEFGEAKKHLNFFRLIF